MVYYSATSRIDSGFKINMYYLIQYIYLLFSNGALTGNYSTFKPSSLPQNFFFKKRKEKPAQYLTSFDLLKHKIILAHGRHKCPCDLFGNEVRKR